MVSTQRSRFFSVLGKYTRLLGFTALLAGCASEGGKPGGSNPGAAGSTGMAGSSAGGTTSAMPGEAGDIGVVPAARLNRNQYDSSVRDLLGTALKPAEGFPADELVLGFDTIGSVLRVQPEHVEKYLSAAEALVAELLARPAGDPLRQRYITCDLTADASCVAPAIKNLASAAWRRPASDTELAPYLALAQAQPDATTGLSLALRAVLTSSKFLFRWELDPNIDDSTPHLVSGHEMATRLSYALWGTTPDAELLAAAASGALQTPEGVLAQTRRLLDSGAGLAPLVNSFGAQWLNVNQVATAVPDAELFPNFDADLRLAMMAESKELLREFLASNLHVSRLFDADFTYVNTRLAQHYGLSPVGEGWHKVPTTGTNRGGLLTLGSFLTTTSNPTRTSPVKRGFFVLDRVLCSAPPPPPADVDLNIDEGSGLENKSVRERVALHTQKGTTCFGCHQVMDPIGLGLENYDAIGAYRTSDAFGPIDATGTLPVGSAPTPFNGARELSALLAADERTLPCVVQKLMTFTLGRELGSPQLPLHAAIASATQTAGGGLRSAIESIVVSDIFRMRRPAAATEVAP